MILKDIFKQLTDDKGLSGEVKKFFTSEEFKEIVREAFKEALRIQMQKGLEELNR